MTRRKPFFCITDASRGFSRSIERTAEAADKADENSISLSCTQGRSSHYTMLYEESNKIDSIWNNEEIYMEKRKK